MVGRKVLLSIEKKEPKMGNKALTVKNLNHLSKDGVNKDEFRNSFNALIKFILCFKAKRWRSRNWGDSDHQIKQ